jgi:enoyl-CoA hydratase/carnithine racemase
VSTIRTEIDGPIGRITLDRPERMNAISVSLARDLEDALRRLGERHDVHVIVVRGADGNFCAGGDFDEVQRLREESPAALRTLFTAFGEACGAIREVPIPVVAAVEGVAMAGGFELMQAADIVLVRDDARIADNHINFGMIPGGGSTARLPRIVGRQAALALLLSGDRLSGTDAVARGLAYRSFAPADFDQAVEAFLAQLAGRDRGAVTMIKRLVNEGLNQPIAQALAEETDAVVRRISGQAGQHGVGAFKNREVRA